MIHTTENPTTTLALLELFSSEDGKGYINLSWTKIVNARKISLWIKKQYPEFTIVSLQIYYT